MKSIYFIFLTFLRGPIIVNIDAFSEKFKKYFVIILAPINEFIRIVFKWIVYLLFPFQVITLNSHIDSIMSRFQLFSARFNSNYQYI